MEEKGNCRKSLTASRCRFPKSRSPEVQWQRLLVVDKVLTDSLQSTLVFAVIKNLVIGFQNFDTFWNIYFLTLETWNSYQVTRAELPVVPEEPLRLTSYKVNFGLRTPPSMTMSTKGKKGCTLSTFPLKLPCCHVGTRAELPVVPGEPLRLTAYNDRPSILAYVQQGNIDVIDEKSQCRFPKSRSR